MDPICVDIVEYRRVGRGAAFEFLCVFKNKRIQKDPGPGKGVWLPYLDVINSVTIENKLKDVGWRIDDHYDNYYSDTESIWDGDGDSCDEEYKARLKRRGAPRIIKKTRRRLSSAATTSGSKRRRSGC